MIGQLIVIFLVACVAYWFANRAPITAPKVKQVVLILIVAIAALLMLGVATGRHLVPGL